MLIIMYSPLFIFLEMLIKSKVFLWSCNVKHNSAAPEAFTVVVILTNHTEL